MTEADQLPPMPDRQTGEPKPPRAPTRSPRGLGKGERWNPRRVPKPPNGHGPVLTWTYVDFDRWAQQAATMAVLTVLYGLGWDFVNGRPFLNFFSTWWMDVVMVLICVWAGFMYWEGWSAGADWLRKGRDNKFGSWVKTYELVSITTGKGKERTDITLRDVDGREVEFNVTAMPFTQDMWDYVYNGIRHSVARGARINDGAAAELRITRP